MNLTEAGSFDLDRSCQFIKAASFEGTEVGVVLGLELGIPLGDDEGTAVGSELGK